MNVKGERLTQGEHWRWRQSRFDAGAVSTRTQAFQHRTVRRSAQLSTWSDTHTDTEHYFLPHAVNCGRFCFWHRQSVVFFVSVWNILGTDLCQIHTEDMFGPSLGQVWRSRSRSNVKVTSDKKRHFLALLAACVRFMFVKISLASSFHLSLHQQLHLKDSNELSWNCRTISVIKNSQLIYQVISNLQ